MLIQFDPNVNSIEEPILREMGKLRDQPCVSIAEVSRNLQNEGATSPELPEAAWLVNLVGASQLTGQEMLALLDDRSSLYGLTVVFHFHAKPNTCLKLTYHEGVLTAGELHEQPPPLGTSPGGSP